ncbi:DUF2334 domain-containing protein [Chloroflexota bacterium]
MRYIKDRSISSILIIFLIIISFAACSTAPPASIDNFTPQAPDIEIVQTSQREVPFNRKVDTALYPGGPAIIFRLDDASKGWNEEIVEQVIRLFGKHNVPLDVGVIPHADGNDSFEVSFLRRYLDAGIIDLSIHANQHIDKEFDTSQSGTNYENLKAALIEARDQIQQYFNVTPVAFTVPYDFFNEEGYKAVQDAGFKIFSTQKAVEFSPSIFAVDYSDQRDENGMSRLCTVSDVARWNADKEQWEDILSISPGSELSQAIDWGLKNLEVAVIGIHPDAFLDMDNNPDTVKLGQLEDIIVASKKLAFITTFKQWYQFTYEVVTGPEHVRGKETPPYHGGPAVIFRMDDGDKGYLEDTVEQMIQIFQKYGRPLDVGVMPHAGNRRSYHMPFLLKYLDAGVIDISMHGYRNTFVEFDTDLSGATFAELEKDLQGCFIDEYGESTYKPVMTNYQDLNSGLLAARAQFKHYFGVVPVAFTVPYDYFNEDGYRAIQDAGFKIFATQEYVDKHISAKEPVDYFGNYDENGMYRVVTMTDVAAWNVEPCNWGEIETFKSPDDELHYYINWAINNPRLGVAVLGVHPQAFVDANNKPDPAKLEKLEKIVKYVVDHKQTYGDIITFQSWYNYTIQQDQSNPFN